MGLLLLLLFFVVTVFLLILFIHEFIYFYLHYLFMKCLFLDYLSSIYYYHNIYTNNNNNYNYTNKEWHMLGLLTFLDPPRLDTKETIHRAMAFGVEVKMITGCCCCCYYQYHIINAIIYHIINAIIKL